MAETDTEGFEEVAYRVERGALNVNAAAPFASGSLWTPPVGYVAFLESWGLRSADANLAEVAICDGDRFNVLDGPYSLGVGLSRSGVGGKGENGFLIQQGIVIAIDTVTAQGIIRYRFQVSLYEEAMFEGPGARVPSRLDAIHALRDELDANMTFEDADAPS